MAKFLFPSFRLAENVLLSSLSMKGLLLLTCLAAVACSPTSYEPQNLSSLKKEVAEYSESEFYQKDLISATQGAAPSCALEKLEPTAKTSPSSLISTKPPSRIFPT